MENRTEETEQIKELYRQYWRYMIDKNEKRLRSLMSEDYYLLHMTGVRQTADEFISGLMKGIFNYYSAEHDSIDVVIDGDVANMIGESRVVAAVYGGSRNDWKLKGDFTLRKENGVWKLTSSRASTY